MTSFRPSAILHQRPPSVSRSLMCACLLDSFRNAMARLADRGWWGYTIAWEGRSRLNVRWGAGLPLFIECHPPAQATRFGTLGTGFDQCPSSLASLGVLCIPANHSTWGSSHPIASRVSSFISCERRLYAHHWARLSRPNRPLSGCSGRRWALLYPDPD